MFRRETHRRLGDVLAALVSDRLTETSCWFGGGTRLALDLGEYRESRDLDFMCSVAAGYGEVRRRVRVEGPQALFHSPLPAHLSLPREARTDQYGVRFPVVVAGATFKLEIVREGRIEYQPGTRPDWSTVDCLTPSDCWALKLLANSDRWLDREAFSRDLIDLAMMHARWGTIPDAAKAKAAGAYGNAPIDDLVRSIDRFLGDAEARRRSFAGLAVDEDTAAEVLQGLEALAADLGGSRLRNG